MSFDGRTIECKLAGFEFDYDVDDCVTSFTAALTHAPEDTSCEPCDRIYKGPLTWLEDSCELPEKMDPNRKSLNMVCASTLKQTNTVSQRPKYGWGIRCGDPAKWTLGESTVLPVEEDIDACNNGVQ